MDKQSIILEAIKYAQQELGEKEFIPGKTYIPASAPSLHPNDVAALVSATLQMWYTEGRYCKLFKRSLSKFTGIPYVSLVNSGSSAILAAMSALTEGDKREYVLTCAAGFPTTAAPIYQCGKIPYYIDIGTSSLTPSFGQIDQALKDDGDNICGAIFTHTMGFPYDERTLKEMLGDNRFLIADCCDSLGALLNVERNTHTGAYADASTHSFFPAHTLFAGEGGAVLCHDIGLHQKINSYISWGRSCVCLPGQQNVCGHRFDQTQTSRGLLPERYDHKYIFDRLGYNLKMTEFQGALGYSQIQRINSFVLDRRLNYQYLEQGLSGIEELGLIKPATMDVSSTRPSPFGFLITSSWTPDLIPYLEARRIRTRRLFAGNLIRQPGFMSLDYKAVSLDGCDCIMDNSFWVGCHPSLTMEMLDYMIDKIRKYFGVYS